MIPNIDLIVEEDEDVIGLITTEDDAISLDCDEAEVTKYTGSYEVAPTFESQVLPTKGKAMTKDLTVKSIQVSRTTNPSGGKTIYIGEV